MMTFFPLSRRERVGVREQPVMCMPFPIRKTGSLSPRPSPEGGGG